MNSVICLNLILKQIQENAHSFENVNDLQKLATVLFKLGNEVMQKPLPSSLLKNVIIAVKQLHAKNIVRNDDYKSFMRDVNKFYNSQCLCESYKLALLSCFSPAVELELISLLKLCAHVSNINELNDIRTAVESSVLIQACQKNVDIIPKTTKILKKAFILSEGNPIVGYLTFCLCRSVEFASFHPYILRKELSGLDTLFQVPYNLITVEDGQLLIKHLIKLCIENEKMKLCTKNDIIFYTAIFPACYRKMLELCAQQSYILDFFILLCNDDNLECKNFIKIDKEIHIWQFLNC